MLTPVFNLHILSSKTEYWKMYDLRQVFWTDLIMTVWCKAISAVEMHIHKKKKCYGNFEQIIMGPSDQYKFKNSG